MLDRFWIRLLGYVYINHIKLELYTFSPFIYRSQISRAEFIYRFYTIELNRRAKV